MLRDWGRRAAPDPGRWSGLPAWGWALVSPGGTDVATGMRSPDRLSAIPVPSAPRDPGGPSAAPASADPRALHDEGGPRRLSDPPRADHLTARAVHLPRGAEPGPFGG